MGGFWEDFGRILGRVDPKVDSYFTLNFEKLQDEGLTLMIRATRGRSIDR